MRQSGCAELVERIIKDTIPMYARMVHGRDPKGELSQQSQQYDIDNEVGHGASHIVDCIPS